MNMETLRDMLSDRFGKEMNISIGQHILDNGLLDEAMKMVLDDNEQIAFRAAWALQWAFKHGDKPLDAFSEHILNTFLNSDNGSVLRIYSKALLQIMPQMSMDVAISDRMAEKAFTLLLDGETKVAVKIWLMEILYNLSDTIAYVAENLKDCVLQLSESSDCTPAMAAHTRQLLRRMQ